MKMKYDIDFDPSQKRNGSLSVLLMYKRIFCYRKILVLYIPETTSVKMKTQKNYCEIERLRGKR